VPRRQTNICTGELRIVYLKRDLRQTCHVDPGMESKPDGVETRPDPRKKMPRRQYYGRTLAALEAAWSCVQLRLSCRRPSRTASESGHGFLPVRGVRHLGSGAPQSFGSFFRHQRPPRQKTSAEGTGGSSDFCGPLTSAAVFDMNICVFYVYCSSL
jgi:hypothetical protein